MNKLSYKHERPHVNFFKDQKSERKMVTGHGQMVHRKCIQMASKHMKRCPCSVTVREMSTKSTSSYHFPLIDGIDQNF